MLNLWEKYSAALPYADFLDRHATALQKDQWQEVWRQAALTAAQQTLLACFKRSMPVLCLAGAWCGDCVNQCPLFARFAEAAPVIRLRYLDRDQHPEVQQQLRINGGDRVPVLVFFSEDGQEVARYGERPLSKYRQLVHSLVPAELPPELVDQAGPLLAQVTQEWLDEFERVHWLLRLSPRLRKIHGD